MISVVSVSWNTRALLARCLESIEQERARTARPLEILVVDNASHDGTPDMIRTRFPAVRLLEPGENLGFSRANNLAMAAARGESLMLLNPDTELHPGALETLAAYLDAHSAVGLVGPRIFYADGREQLTRHRFPTLLSLFVASTPLVPALAPLLRGYYLDADPGHVQPVDWLSGAALMVRRAVVEQVGGFDERFFMYFEETDWQRRIKGAGWSIHYVPDAIITHHEDASGGQVVASRQRRFNQSRLRYAAKWHGAGWAGRLRLWLRLLYAIEWGKEGLKWLLGHKRPLRRARLRAYGELIRDGLG